MTVAVSIVNHGSHPDDRIEVFHPSAEHGIASVLMRGAHLMIRHDRPYQFRVMDDGAGHLCREHKPVVAMTEGPGKRTVRKDGAWRPPVVERLEALAAAIINEIEAVNGDDERARLKAIAVQELEGALMWAVKAVT